MEIQVSKLNDLMALLKPVVPKKTTLPITAFISLGNGKAVATDLETMVIADLPEAEEPMLLPFASLAEMLKYVPGDDTIKIEAKHKKVSLTWEGGTASYPTEAVQDFPLLGEMPIKAEGLIDGDTLIAAMLAALPYASTETNRPVLNGLTLILGSPIEVAAGDGFRMSHQVLGLAFPLEEKTILPTHSVDILGHVFAKTPRTPPSTADSLIQVINAKRQIHMALMDGKLRIDFGQAASVVVNLVDGEPPNFLALIPKGEPLLQSQIFAPQLEAAIKRVRAVAKDGSGTVRMVFADGKLTVSAGSKDGDQRISASMDTLVTQGEPGRTALNYTYLLDYLSGKQGVIVFSKYTEQGPVVFGYQNTPKVLIMPMFVEWGDKKAAAEEKPETEPTEGTTNPESDDKVEASLEEQMPESIPDDSSIAVAQEPQPPVTNPKPKRRRKKSITTS